ncbi:MAG: hypothetical protein IT449_05070 [Phycisphaerales bacterium]|nr:hypothetical protein [Phycisphaerales bacterium]
MASLAVAAAGCFLIGGCAADGGTHDQRFVPFLIEGPTHDLHARVLGNLADLIEPPRPRPGALERILFGDRTPPRMRLRTPQGLAMLEGDLLVCDQGRSAVISVNLPSGRAAFLADARHLPDAPLDIAVGHDGRIFVIDAARAAIIEYDAARRRVGELRVPPSASTSSFAPVSLALSADVLCVGCTGPGRVERFDLPRREWLAPISTGYDGISIVAPTGLCVAEDGALYVVDAVAACVHRFSDMDVALPPIGRPGRGEGELLRPKHACVTPSGLVAVTDAARQSVVVFDREGRFELEIARNEPHWPGFTLPCGIVRLDGSALPQGVSAELAPHQEAAEYLLVSDSLGDVSLTLVELQRGGEPGGAP